MMARGLCEKHYMADYYKRNSEVLIARAGKRYADDPQKFKDYSKRHSEADPARKKAWDAAWVKANPERHNAHGAAYYAANKEKVSARSAARRKAKNAEYKVREAAMRATNRTKYNATLRAWKKRNPQKVMADSAKRRAVRFNATPAWANEFFIEEIYDLARLRTKHLGVQHHVDHIVPLRSEIVCGLHCEANLQVISGAENQSKNNRHWPDMPT